MSEDWPKNFFYILRWLTYLTKIKQRNERQQKYDSDFTPRRLFYVYLLKQLEIKIEEAVEEDQFGFRKGQGTRNGFALMRIISESELDVSSYICKKLLTVSIKPNCCKCLKITRLNGGNVD